MRLWTTLLLAATFSGPAMAANVDPAIQAVLNRWCSGKTISDNLSPGYAWLVYRFRIADNRLVVDANWALNSHDGAKKPETGMTNSAAWAVSSGKTIHFIGSTTHSDNYFTVVAPDAITFRIVENNGYGYHGTMQCAAP